MTEDTDGQLEGLTKLFTNAGKFRRKKERKEGRNEGQKGEQRQRKQMNRQKLRWEYIGT